MSSQMSWISGSLPLSLCTSLNSLNSRALDVCHKKNSNTPSALSAPPHGPCFPFLQQGDFCSCKNPEIQSLSFSSLWVQQINLLLEVKSLSTTQATSRKGLKTYHDDEAAAGEDKERETGLRLLPPQSDCKQTLARSRWRPTATTSENEILKDETLEKQVLKSNPPLPPLSQAGFFLGEISPNGEFF